MGVVPELFINACVRVGACVCACVCPHVCVCARYIRGCVCVCAVPSLPLPQPHGSVPIGKPSQACGTGDPAVIKLGTSRSGKPRGQT